MAASPALAATATTSSTGSWRSVTEQSPRRITLVLHHDPDAGRSLGGHVAAGPRASGGAARRDDARGEARPAPAAWVGAELSSGNVAPLQEAFADPASLEELSAHGLGHFTRPLGTSPVDPVDGARRLARAAARAGLAHAARHPGDRARGVPDRLHHLRRDGLPDAAGARRHFDPDGVERMTRAIGESMRAVGVHQGLSPVVDVVRDYRWGRVEETFGEDPYLVGHDRQRLRARPRVMRARGHAQALRRLLRVAGRAQPRAGGGRPAHAARRAAGAVRDGGARGRRPLGDELLQRDRRRAGRRGRRPAHGRPARRVGLRGRRRVGLLGDHLPADHAPRRRHAGATRPRSPSRRGSTSSCRTAAATPSRSPRRCATAACPRSCVDRAARRVLRQKAELGCSTPTGPRTRRRGRRRAGHRPAGAPRARPRARRGVRRAAGQRRHAAAAAGAASDRARRAVRRRPARLPRLLLVPEPRRHAGPSRTSAWGSRCPRCSTRCARAAGASVVHEPGCPISEPDRSRPRRRRSRRPRDADVCVAVVGDRPGLFGRGTSGEGCDAEDLCAARHPGRAASTRCWPPAPRSSSSSSRAGPTRSGATRAAAAASCRRSCPARRARRRSPACSRGA